MKTNLRTATALCAAAFLAAASAPVLAAGASAPAAAPAPAPAPAAPIDPEKQKVINKILLVFHPENNILVQVQRPAGAAMEQSGIALQTNRVPKDRAEQTMKDIGADAQKYVDTATPLAAASAKKNIPGTVGPILAQNFSLEELKQLDAMLEAPVKAKFEKLLPDIDKALGEKVTTEVGPEINKDIQALNQSASTKLRTAITMTQQGGAAGPAASSAK